SRPWRRQQSLRLRGKEAVVLDQLRPGLALVVAEAGVEEMPLLSGSLGEFQELRRRLAMGLVHPGRVQGDIGMVRGERSLARVDRDHGDLRRGVFAQAGRIPAGVAVVVVPDRLLLDRDRRYVG